MSTLSYHCMRTAWQAELIFAQSKPVRPRFAEERGRKSVNARRHCIGNRTRPRHLLCLPAQSDASSVFQCVSRHGEAC